MRLLAVCALVGACHAELDGPSNVITSQVDSSVPGDTSVVDVPIDARPCEGGDAHAPDPATSTCFVYFATPRANADAVLACTAINAQLGVIKSATTNSVVRSIIGTTDALIAATDSATEGTFLWRGDASDPLSGGYTNWRQTPLEPNNGGPEVGANEDCAVIEVAGTWDDRPCMANPTMTAGLYPYVCQF